METSVPWVVYAIWWTVLFLVIVLIVPLAVMLLHRTLVAALSIRRYLREMLQAGIGIAGNTGSIGALQETIGVAVAMVSTAGNMKEHTGTIAAVLSQRAARQDSP